MEYTTPPGYYDLPFTWVFDASALADGNTYQNQVVYIQGGYGDFYLRRIAGMDRVLNPTTGRFRVKDHVNRLLGDPPIFVGNVTDQAVAGELFYPETGRVSFDLYNVLRKTEQNQVTPIYSAQIAFQGVRRLKGANPFESVKQYKPKSFSYNVLTAIPAAQNPAGVAVAPVKVVTPANDYPFELWNLEIIYQTLPSASIGAGPV